MVVGRNNAWNMEDLVKSLKSQLYGDFSAVLADDNSSDGMYDAWVDLTKGDSRFDQFYNETQHWSLSNQIKAIDYMCDDKQDVIVKLDTDDLLNRTDALSLVALKYNKEGAWMTYGTTMFASNKKLSKQWAKKVVVNNSFRRNGWRSRHLSTYKKWLWDMVDHDRSLKENGEYYRMTEDRARVYPMLEMSGFRTKYIEQPIYWYNDTLSTNDHATVESMREQTRVAKVISGLKPYKRLPRDFEV
jgi:glycosyltransferase involved in cell wall biosynthesis